MPEENKPCYWVALVDELQPPPPELYKFETLEEMAAFLRDVSQNRSTAWVLPFYGVAVRTEEDGRTTVMRYVLGPEGERVSVSEDTKESQPQEGFYPVMGYGYFAKIMKAMQAAEDERKRVSKAPAARRFEYVQEEPEDEEDSELDTGDEGLY